MDIEQKGLYFVLSEEHYQLVCKVANEQDTTLGMALGLLIQEGYGSLSDESANESNSEGQA